MKALLKPIFFLLVFLALVGASLVVSASVSDETAFADPLGDLNVPEGIDVVQLPENLILGATLPEVLDKPTTTEATTTPDAIAPARRSFNADGSESDTTSDVVDNLVPSRGNADGNKKIVIHLASQTMDMVEGGTILNSYKISSGKRGMQTPTGTFKVLSKNPRAYSKTYGLYMPYWMAFTTRGHGIHELPEWPNGYKEGENHLGTPVSHGCVRLGVGSAKAMYDWAGVGIPVEVVLH